MRSLVNAWCTTCIDVDVQSGYAKPPGTRQKTGRKAAYVTHRASSSLKSGRGSLHQTQQLPAMAEGMFYNVNNG